MISPFDSDFCSISAVNDGDDAVACRVPLTLDDCLAFAVVIVEIEAVSCDSDVSDRLFGLYFS